MGRRVRVRACRPTLHAIRQVYFGVDAVLSENEFQYAAMHVTSVVFTAFIIWNVFHNATSLGPIWDDHGGIGRWTVLGIASAVQIALLCLARPVWNSFGFFAYKVRLRLTHTPLPVVVRMFALCLCR